MSKFKVGDKVKVLETWYRDSVGTVTRLEDKNRVIVEIKGMNVIFYDTDIEKIKDEFKVGDKIQHFTNSPGKGVCTITYIYKNGISAVVEDKGGVEYAVYLSDFRPYVPEPKFKVGDIVRHKKYNDNPVKFTVIAYDDNYIWVKNDWVRYTDCADYYEKVEP